MLIGHVTPLLLYLNHGKQEDVLAPARDLAFLALDLIESAESTKWGGNCHGTSRDWEVIEGYVTLPASEFNDRIKSYWLKAADGEIFDLLRPEVAGTSCLARSYMTENSEYLEERIVDRVEASILYSVLKGALEGINDFTSQADMKARWLDLVDQSGRVLSPETTVEHQCPSIRKAG